ncbi:von Willebrand factor type A domain-containing protein [uncultured Winogradskyella sp.]|uniref:YfbK domain-containing protein n=1 Tax=uncultured Winogradskyella sp. TaxID=395353 RepID=UPI00260EEDDC|nr:von Willebrand factor type A domain-containing protein [uncultured Winogradskyella sp.]
MKIILNLVVVLLFTTQLSGQEKTISGTVTTAYDGLPLPGANVTIKGTSNGIQTDFDGNYTLKVNIGDVLVVSYIGMKNAKKAIAIANIYNFALESDNSLDEVVVIGYGTTKKATSRVSSVSIVSESIVKQPSAGFAQTLSGQVAGLDIKSSTTQSFDNPNAELKGIVSSQVKAEPLYIVDGIAITKGYNDIIKNLDPNTIEHINTYKPAKAINMFGNKANHGCVIITTKSGKYRIENDEAYAKITENDFNAVHLSPLSTFSIDVDKASYSNLRRMINNGQNIPYGAVKIEEMINYFNYNYPQPKDKHPFSISTEVVKTPWHNDTQLVRIGLQGKTYKNDELPASNLTFLIDVSGSMSSQNKLPLLKKAFKLLVKQLRKRDMVSIIVYAGAAGVVLEPTSGDKKDKIIDAIENLNSGGSTAGGAGIKLAYKLAEQNFKINGNNRVILATDGDFNVGASSDDDMQALIEKKRKSGVFLSVLGFGYGNYKDSKLEILADKGNGNHAYIDNMQEAQKIFGKEFGGTLFTIAKDVKIQVEFNPNKVHAYRLIGYENRLLADEDFVDDTKDAGELGSGHAVTALYEIIPFGVKSDYLKKLPDLKYTKKTSTVDYDNELFTVKFRYKKPKGSKSIEIIHVQGANQTEASEDMNFACAIALFGMQLRNSKFTNNASISKVLELAENGRGEDAEGYRAEFIRLVKSYRNFN